jgi:dCMP deaminase
MNKWDQRFLELAQLVSTWSKDPSTQVGAVVVDENRRVVSLGFNGFPKGASDDPALYLDRDYKYKVIQHAEENAILFAERALDNCTLYVYPFMPCSKCAGKVMQTGIIRVVAPKTPKDKEERWGPDFELAKSLFTRAGIELTLC